jgi:hypothetical protein
MFYFALELGEDIKKFGNKIFTSDKVDFSETPLKKVAAEPAIKADEIDEKKQCLIVEDIIRKNLKLSQIESYFNNKLPIPSYLSDLNYSNSILKKALEEATHIYALFVGIGSNNLGESYAHNISIELEKTKEGKGTPIVLGGNKSRVETSRTIIEHAVERASHAVFSYMKKLQTDLGIPVDPFLDLRNMNITCTIEDDDFGTIDGQSICLPVAIAILSKYLGIPTKKKTALTGIIKSIDFGSVIEVGEVITKIEKAIESGFYSVVIPHKNYISLEKEGSGILKSLSDKIRIYPVTCLDEAVKGVFDFERVKMMLANKQGALPKPVNNEEVESFTANKHTPPYGLEFKEIISRNYYFANYDFKGEIVYSVKNILGGSMYLLPPEQVAWEGWGIKLKENGFSPKVYDEYRELYSISKQIFSHNEIIDKGPSGTNEKVTVFDWKLKIEPPLASGEKLIYGQIIETSNTEKKAFSEQGSWVGGMRSPFNVETMVVEIYAPEGYNITFKHYTTREQTGMSRKHKGEPPRLLDNGKKIIWEVKNPIPLFNYLIKIKIKKDER